MIIKTEVKITTACPFCGRITTLSIPVDDCIAWQNGSLVQNAFPDLSAEDREVLLSGICWNCQINIFG
jgi:hypothetical protein